VPQRPDDREELTGSRDRNHRQGSCHRRAEPSAGADAAVGQRGPAQRRALAWQDRLHRRVEAPGGRAADGAAAEHRRGRPGRPERPWRRDAGRARLSDRVLPALAAALRARRLHVRHVRGEPHRRRPPRRGGLHRRPIPHRGGGVRGHPAPCHLLPGRNEAGRTRTPLAARQPPPSGLLHARHHRGAHPERRRHHQDQDRAGRPVGGRHRRAALPPGPRPRKAPHRPGYPRPEPRLAGLVPRPAGACPGRGRDLALRRRDESRTQAGLGRLPEAERRQDRPRERERVLDLPGRPRRQRAPHRPAGPVRHAPGQRRGRSGPGPQLLPIVDGGSPMAPSAAT